MMAQMISFPQRRNVGKARHVARIYLGKQTDKAKATYWSEICRRLEMFMRRCGFTTEEIEHEILSFKQAVENEMAILMTESGGAA